MQKYRDTLLYRFCPPPLTYVCVCVCVCTRVDLLIPLLQYKHKLNIASLLKLEVMAELLCWIALDYKGVPNKELTELPSRLTIHK